MKRKWEEKGCLSFAAMLVVMGVVGAIIMWPWIAPLLVAARMKDGIGQ